jgi:predicted DNA-binding transcriptional regulator AlpA
MNEERLITITEFMQLLGVRARSTFLNYERKMDGFPERVWLTPEMPRFRLTDALDFIGRLKAA